jgi:hypothetical protein
VTAVLDLAWIPQSVATSKVFLSIKSSRGLVGMGSLTAVLGDGKAAVAMTGEMVPSGLVAEDGGLALTRAFEQEGRNRDEAVAAEKKAWESQAPEMVAQI